MGGGHDLKAARRAAAGDSSLHDHIVPGKTTGVPIVDKHTLCDRKPEHDDCWLDKDDRTRLLLSLNLAVVVAMANFRDAIQNVHVELLTMTRKSAGSWGLFAEILFGAASSGIIGVLTKSLTGFTARAAEAASGGGELTIGDGYPLPALMIKGIAKIKPKHIGTALVQASKGMRTALKNAAHRPADVSKEDAAAADFCTIIQEGIAPLTRHIAFDAPTNMTDFEIAALVASYEDDEAHSVAAYESVVRDLIDRFKDQHLAEIGDGMSNGTDQMSDVKAVIVLGKDGARRVAIVEFFDPIWGDNNTRYHRTTTDRPAHWNQPEFKSWVDHQLEPVATATQLDRYGDMPVLDATAEPTGMATIDTWSADPYKDSP